MSESFLETTPPLGSAQNAIILGEVIVDPTVLKIIEEARAGTSFAAMRQEYGLAAQGSLGMLETAGSSNGIPAPEVPQA